MTDASPGPSSFPPEPPAPASIGAMFRQGAAFLRKLGPAAILGAAWTAMPACLGFLLVYKLGPISDWLQSLGPWGLVVYSSVFMFSAGIGFLPTYGQSFLGGWTFGFWSGFAGSMVGFVGGSLIGFLIARMVSKQRIETTLRDYPRGKAVRDALLRHGFWRALGIITLIRIPPNSPFALTNLVLASSGAKLGPYILGTAIGMAPRTAIAVWIASRGAHTGAADIQELLKEQPWWVVPGTIGIAIVVLSILGVIANRAIHSVTRPEAEAVPATPVSPGP